ncbi:hypothetical protein [Streptomyces palmae]|uniref:Uncharacterized protein n=1 Tax=Streptomyces palmae TaxID=1701085 RepID=A0A4Z0FV25_9ACTN|nr:hypothetical protein [Streptomyces palmae]TGA86535.1 hypothetical protein E4099_30425 [Streptomyces palmae]
MVDLEERLHDLVRAAEPSIRLAGPEAARTRGQRRRVRRRASIAASAVFTATALTLGSWQLLPDHGPPRTLPAAPPTAPKTAHDIPASALLPASAVPFERSARWKADGSTDTVTAPLLDLPGKCRLTGLDTARTPRPVEQRSRSYSGRQEGQQARHTINAYAQEQKAAQVFTALEKALVSECGLHQIGFPAHERSGSAGNPMVKTFAWSSDNAPHGIQVVLMRAGSKLGILQAKELEGFSAESADDLTTYCTSVALWRLHPTAASSPPPYEPDPEAGRKAC